MTTRELLENANLAALGLLDQEEHGAYERALTKAPASVREHILREQARWAGGGELLPAVEAPEHLRERVMDAVRGAIVDDEIAHSAIGLDEPTFGGRRRVSALWRGGALGLLCACVALTGMLFYTRESEKESSERLAAGTVVDGLRGSFGHQFVKGIVFDASTQRVAMLAQDPSFMGKVTLYTNDEWPEWRAVSADMPSLADGEQYCLVELKDDGGVARKLASINANAQLDSVSVTPVESGTRIALVVSVRGRDITADHILLIARIA